MQNDIYMLQITEFVDDYKLRGQMPSKTQQWFFDDISKAYEKLHEWLEDMLLDRRELSVDDIKGRCADGIEEFEFSEWCHDDGVPLDECPCINTFLKAVCPAEFVPVKFQVVGPMEIELERSS